MKHRNPLGIPLIILVGLFLLLTTSSKFISNNDLSEYLINVSVEVLGAIITVIFIDIYLSKQESMLQINEKELLGQS